MKKFISLVLSLVMALSLCVPAWGATTVTTEGELKAALAAGGEVVLGANITLTTSTANGNFEIPATAGTVVLNLNGYTITAPNRDGYTDRTQYVFDNYADLTIKGTGTINSRGIQNYGKLTIENGVTVKAVDVNGGAGIWAYAGSETIINGGTFTAAEAAGCVNSAGKLTINGGTFTQTQSTAAYCYAINFSGTEGVITDATVNGAHGCVAVTAGTMTVKGGSFTTTGVNAQSDHVLYVSAGAKIVVEDGNFVGDHEAGGTSLYNNASTASVTGGSFSDDVTDYVEPGSTVVIAGDTVAKNSDGSVVVNPVAQVGNTKYETVAAAIAAANGAPVVLLDPSATIPAGYTVATDVNGNLVVLAGTNVSASAAKGAYYTTDMTTLAVYPGCDLTNYKYALEHYTSGAAAAKTFDQKVIWKTDKVTGAKTIDGVYVVAASSESADLAFVNGSQITYLSNVAAYTGTVTALPTVDAKDAAKCGDMFVGGDYAAYTDANAKMYVEKAGGTVYNAGGKYVELVEVTPNTTYIVDTLLANPAGYAPYTLYIVSHEYGVDYKTVATKTEVTNVYCKECKATFAFVEGTKADAVKKFGAGNYIDFGAGLFVAKVANGSVVTPSTDKVESAETFDAGIAMYVGMSVMAAAGSAVVLKKKD